MDLLPALVEALELLLEGVPVQLLPHGSDDHATASLGNDLPGQLPEA